MANLNLPEKRVFIGPANLWKRILAFVVDILILEFLVIGIFKGVIEKILGSTGDVWSTYRMLEENSSQLRALSMLFMLIVTLALVYFVLLQYAVGQTVGCLLLNLHVVQQLGDKEFTRPGFWQCVLRNMFIIPTIPFVILWIADPVYFFFAKRGQRLTEWLSRTRVVEQFVI
ncbi:RDD family protein [Nanoarchaeota archaeon]